MVPRFVLLWIPDSKTFPDLEFFRYMKEPGKN